MTTDASRAGLWDLPVFFLHAGGLPQSAIGELLGSTNRLGRPDDAFDIDGSMWTRLRDQAQAGFTDYLISLVEKASTDGQRFSALIDWRDLLWLERRPAFRDLLQHPFRAVRLAYLDPALQARRRLVKELGSETETTFQKLSREVIAIEEDEAIGDDFARRYNLQLPRLWVEDLSRTDVPALRGLLDRWSIPLLEETKLRPINTPTGDELDAVSVFRSEARRQHWAHALTPRPA